MHVTTKTTAAALLLLAALLPACIPNDSPRTGGSTSSASQTAEPAAKLSRSGICHERGTGSYAQTTNFTAFDSLAACLQQGRLPRGNGGETASAVPAYDRDAFGGWIDANRDCINTRHEVLQELSTAVVTMKTGCSVGHGRWLDPYTDQIFTNAQDLDIDHIVPLAYAWERGAHGWPADKRVRFANDPVNLLPVQAAVNRQKGAQGPTEWLPPAEGYRCQYVLRFQRIAASYDLVIPAAEAAQINALRAQYC